MRTLCAFMAVGVVLSFSLCALAQEKEDSEIEKHLAIGRDGVTLFEKWRFDDALPLLEQAAAYFSELETERKQVYREEIAGFYSALAQVLLDSDDPNSVVRAVDAFKKARTLRPAMEPDPAWPPRVMTAWQLAEPPPPPAQTAVLEVTCKEETALFTLDDNPLKGQLQKRIGLYVWTFSDLPAGKHTLKGTLPSSDSQDQFLEVELKGGETTKVRIDFPDDHYNPKLRVASYVLFGAGAAGLLGGGAAQLRAEQLVDKWHEGDEQNDALKSDIRTDEAISYALFGIGGAAIVGGIVTYILSGKKDASSIQVNESPSLSLGFLPRPGGAQGFLRIQF